MTISKIKNLFVILMLTFTLSGCFGAILGAAAGGAGAYYTKKEIDKSNARKSHAIEKKTRIEEREKFSRQVKDNVNKDDKISLDLTSKMLGGGLTKILSVHTIVKDGVVTLYGNAPSQEVVNRAIDMARREAGVKKVINNLVVVNVRIIAPRALQRSESSIPPSPSLHSGSPVLPNATGSAAIGGAGALSPTNVGAAGVGATAGGLGAVLGATDQIGVDARKMRAMDLEKKIFELEEKSRKKQKEMEDNPLIRQLKADGTLEKHSAFEREMEAMKAEKNGFNRSGEVTGLTVPRRANK